MAAARRNVGPALVERLKPHHDRLKALADADLPHRSPACEAIVSSCSTSIDCSTLTTRVCVEASVSDLPYNQAKCLAAPQNWDSCSDYIDEVNVTQGTPATKCGAWNGRIEETVLLPFVGGGTMVNSLDFTMTELPGKPGCMTTSWQLDRTVSGSLGGQSIAMELDSGSLAVCDDGSGGVSLTMCKELRFADMTLSTYPPGPVDYGQLLNYLAPALVALWLQLEVTRVCGCTF
jgi:hypothetical protein